MEKWVLMFLIIEDGLRQYQFFFGILWDCCSFYRKQICSVEQSCMVRGDHLYTSKGVLVDLLLQAYFRLTLQTSDILNVH
jgi:hypothetical protein